MNDEQRAELDIEKIEREAYERGMKDIAEVVEQWYDNYCRTAAIADACKRALEGRNDELGPIARGGQQPGHGQETCRRRHVRYRGD